MSKINLDDRACDVKVDVNIECRQIDDDRGNNDEVITTAYNKE